MRQQGSTPRAAAHPLSGLPASHRWGPGGQAVAAVADGPAPPFTEMPAHVPPAQAQVRRSVVLPESGHGESKGQKR